MIVSDNRLEVRDGLAQPRFKRHVRFPFQPGLWLNDVGLAYLRVLGRKRLVRDCAVAVRGLDNESGKVQNRPPVGVGVADVDRGLNIRPEEVLKPVDGIRNGAKTPGSCAITGDGQVLASQCLPDEGGDDAPVVGPHPGAVRIEDARDADVEVVFVAIGADERLAIPFRFVVTRPGTVGVDVTAVVFRLGIEFGVAVHLAGRCEEVLGVFLLSDAEGLVGAQRADLERLDGLVPVEDWGVETREVDHPVKVAGHVDELRDVVFVEREAVVVEHVVEVVGSSRDAVFHRDDLVAVRDEGVTQVRANEAGAAGDEDSTHRAGSGAAFRRPGSCPCRRW